MALKFDDPKQEAVKEVVRMLLISILPVLISGLESQLEIKVIVVSVVIAVLRGLDKYLYMTKSENPATELLKLEGIK